MPKAIKHLQAVVREIDEPLPGVKRLVLTDQDGWRLPAFRPERTSTSIWPMGSYAPIRCATIPPTAGDTLLQ